MFKIAHYFILIFLLTSCSGLNLQSVRQPVRESMTLMVKMPEPNRLRFEGKGAAAGIALMSTMGPTGSAIGVAIDEGIGKEIEEQLQLEQYNVVDALRQMMQKALLGLNADGKKVQVDVARYGFKTWAKKTEFTDPVSAEFQLVIKVAGNPDVTIDYPSQFKGDIPLIPLESARSDGKLAIAVLEQSLALIAIEFDKTLKK